MGEKHIIRNFLKIQDFPAKNGNFKRTHMVVRLAWHVTSVTWAAIGILLGYLHFVSGNATKAFLSIVTVMFLISAGMSLFWVKGKHPSWIVFLTISALTGYTAFQGS